MTTETLYSVHEHYVKNAEGDIVDVYTFCSDFCHRAYCAEQGLTYGGWNGCNESPEGFCMCCGEFD